MYDHYIALDWAQTNMAIARMGKKSETIKSMDVPSDLGNLKDYLRSLKGSKILVFEETTTAQWLYTELRPLVKEVVVCDPYRNKLLSEGAKTDRIDAEKLVKLLRNGLLKPVYHSHEQLIFLRKLLSGYDDLVQKGVRLKNQRSALLRGVGLSKKGLGIPGEYESFVLERIDRSIAEYERDKEEYGKKFEEIAKKMKVVRDLKSVPGVGKVGSIKIAATVVNAERFISCNHFLSYCGLVRHDRISGGRSYGSKRPRHRRDLKSVFKTAALSCITHDGDFKQYYEYLIEKKKYPEFKARHAVARKIATTAFGIMKGQKRYNWKKVGAIREIKK